jgi:ADP-heptose:LPS heptosyltransferase
MNLRVRDQGLYWIHRGLAAMGKIRAPSLDEIRQKDFRRVLIVATTAIGDAVLCTPLIRSLRLAKPNLHLGFWVSNTAYSLFQGDPSLNVVIPYCGKYRRVRETMDALKNEQFDLALVANANDPDVIPMIWWSGCRRIIRRPQRYTIYSFMVANPEMLSRSHTSGHAIERNLEFCDLIGIPRGPAETVLTPRSDAEQRINSELKTISSYVAVHPGSSRSKKQWGADNYIQVARHFLQKHQDMIVLTGNGEEKEMCDQIENGIGCADRVRNLAGQINLAELAIVVKRAKLFLSGDTGPYHIAMAMGTPSVTLFAPWDVGSSAAINGPYFKKERHLTVETSEIGQPISVIRIESVLQALDTLLQSAPIV